MHAGVCDQHMQHMWNTFDKVGFMKWPEECCILDHDSDGVTAVATSFCSILQVAFDDLHLNAKSTASQKRVFWESSRRLQQGNLVVLWRDSKLNQAAAPEEFRQPSMTFATVSQRDEMKLARFERPVISIRYLSQQRLDMFDLLLLQLRLSQV